MPDRRTKLKIIMLHIVLLPTVLFVFYFFTLAPKPWVGVDEAVVEKIAKEHGREARKPFIGPGEGDLLLFLFLTAGAVGGFAAGYCWRRLVGEKSSKMILYKGPERTAMIKGSDRRQADHPIDNLFLDRWSPRAMSGEEIPEEELLVLFEAARWAPSSANNQPWRILYAHRDSTHWPHFYELLVDTNKVWAKNAAALLLFISKTTFDSNGKPYPTHSYDTGAAWENLALQGFLRGYVVHGMQGFDYERARVALNIPEAFRVEAMAAIGKPGDNEALPEELRKREAPNERRKLEQTICEGPFCL
jgi:nitroreductase/ABC-type cobalt transport system substrate-binding protein